MCWASASFRIAPEFELSSITTPNLILGVCRLDLSNADTLSALSAPLSHEVPLPTSWTTCAIPVHDSRDRRTQPTMALGRQDPHRKMHHVRDQ